MKKKGHQVILIGAVCATVSLALWFRGVLRPLENVSWSRIVRAKACPGTATDDIVIITLDQQSLDWGEEENDLSWPWPRSVYVPIIDFCRRAGAKAVIFDVIFSEVSEHADQDEALGAAIKRCPAFAAAMPLGAGSASSWPDGARKPSLSIEGLDSWRRATGTNINVGTALLPISEVAANASILGDVMGGLDTGGVILRVRLFRVFDGRIVPLLGAAPLFKEARAASITPGTINIDGRKIPVDRDGKIILRYRGPSGTHRSFSARDVILSELALQNGEEPSVQPEKFRDRYVFFGFTAPGLYDLRPSPVSDVYPGVETHATCLDNLLSGDAIGEAGSAAVTISITLFCLAAVLGLMYSRRLWQIGIAIACIAGLPIATGSTLYDHGIWYPVAAAETGGLLSIVSALTVSFLTEGRQKRFIKKAFQHYLSGHVVQQLLDDPAQLRLGGECRELTIFFSDIEGFSGIAERLDPQRLTTLLNDYLSEMTTIILDEGGTLDKYEGDAVIAFWNAPVSQPDHALRACRAALICQDRLRERRDEFSAGWGVTLKTRIGIHTGEVVVGNMGSSSRFNYTVLGDAANLASRLEGANKHYGTNVMISEATWKKAGPAARTIGRIRVVGRTQPVKVYEPLSADCRITEDQLDIFHQALEKVDVGDLAAAVGLFEQFPDDPVSRLYIAECRKHMDDGAAWDGIWQLSEK